MEYFFNHRQGEKGDKGDAGDPGIHGKEGERVSFKSEISFNFYVVYMLCIKFLKRNISFE